MLESCNEKTKKTSIQKQAISENIELDKRKSKLLKNYNNAFHPKSKHFLNS